MGLWKTEIDPFLESSMGIYTGRTVYNRFGRATDLSFDTQIDIWNGPTDLYTFTEGIIGQAGVSYYISSSNASDLQNFYFSGIDEKGFEQSHSQPINGQIKTRLSTSLLWFRFWNAININSISLQGDLYIYEDSTVTNGIPDDLTKIRGFVKNSDNESQMGIWTLPLNEHGALSEIILGISNKVQATVAFEIYARLVGRIFTLRGAASINSLGTGIFQRSYPMGSRFLPGADILVRAQTKTNSLDVIADFDIKRRLIY